MGTETNVPILIKTKGIKLIYPSEYSGLPSTPKPEIKNTTVAGILITTPIPEDVPTAFFILLPQLINNGTLRVPPPIPKIADKHPIRKLIILCIDLKKL